jgi:hypothetical protein
MGTIVVRNAVVRKPGFLYYVNKNGDVCISEMKHGRESGTKNKKKKVKKTTVKKASVKKTSAKKR